MGIFPGTSPLGQFAPVVAAVGALAIVFGFLAAVLVGNAAAVNTLSVPFYLAVGAILGTATAVPAINGHVAAMSRSNAARLDAMGAPSTGVTDPHGV